MQLGMIGLGRMGSNMARRLIRAGHHCVVYDINQDAVHALALDGAAPADSLQTFVATLEKPRAIWLMLPAAVVDRVLTPLSGHLEPGDIVIDGGNSHYHDDIRRAAALAAKQIHYIDVGTSGGTWGLERGYCLMIGGEEESVRRLDPIFAALAPGVDAAYRIAGRERIGGTVEQGYLYCGPNGAGHFVKMVHNGIEYGMMAALAEGFNVLHHADAGQRRREADAETAPLRVPEYYQYKFSPRDIAEVWRRGSVIASWLLDLTAAVLLEDPALSGYEGRVGDSGEGRWTVTAAIEESVPVPVLSAALFERFNSRGQADFANRLLSAMRHEFGGHIEKRAA